ncbi:hypothetical protein FQA39_LY01427 [Lamprigera yunnana]|nr:hypothetical protein FQA39_LY01427 [Lamprigera yunnana]
MLGNNIEELQRELEKIKCVAFDKWRKVGLQLPVAAKTGDRNILIKSQQKRRIYLQTGINSQRSKSKSSTQTTNQQTEKLSTEIYKLRDSVLDIETKADTFCKVNDTKYNQVWDFNKKRASKLLQQILNIDKVLYEQQLGLNWNHPPNALMEKTELPSYRSALQALGIKQKEDVQILLEYFLPYTYCPICKNASPTTADKSEIELETYDFSSSSNNTTPEVQISDMLSVVHQPNEVIDVIVSALTVSVNDNVSTSPELKDDIEQPDVSRRSTIVYSSELDKLKSSKLRESTSKSCYRKHPLLISSIYILRALREFFTKFYVVKDSVITMTTRLSQKRNTISRLMTEEDVKSYWGRYKEMFPSKKEEVWDALYIGLQKYHDILKDRRKLNDEVLELREQNIQLKQLLSSYEKDTKNKIRPPCGIKIKLP